MFLQRVLRFSSLHMARTKKLQYSSFSAVSMQNMGSRVGKSACSARSAHRRATSFSAQAKSCIQAYAQMRAYVKQCAA